MISTKRFILVVVLFFVATIGFFNIDSYMADKYKLNEELLIGSILVSIGGFTVLFWHKIKSIFGNRK